MLHEITQIQRPPEGVQRVPRRRHGDEGFTQQRGAEMAIQHQAADQQVRFLLLEQLAPAGQRRLVQLDTHLRVGRREGFQRPCQHIRRKQLIHCDGDLALHTCRQRIGHILECPRILDQLTRPAQQQFTRLGQPDIAPDRLQHLHAQQGLQAMHGVIQGRGALVDRGRRAREAAVVHHGGQHLPLSQCHA